MKWPDRRFNHWTLLWGAFFVLGILFGLGYDTIIKSSTQTFAFPLLGPRPFTLDFAGSLLWGPVVGMFEWLRFGHIRLRSPFWMYSPFESLGSSQFAFFSATFLSALGLTILLAVPMVGAVTPSPALLFLGMAILLVVGIGVAILLYGAKEPKDNS